MSQVFNKISKEVVLTRIFSSLVSDSVHILFYSHILKVILISNIKKNNSKSKIEEKNTKI